MPTLKKTRSAKPAKPAKKKRTKEAGVIHRPDRPAQVAKRDDWFKLCGSLIDDLAAMEKLLQEYYFKIQCKPDPESQQQARLVYQSKHPTAFYDEEQQVPSWKKPALLKGGAIGVVVGLLLGIIVRLLLIQVLPMPVWAVLGAVLGGLAGYMGCRSTHVTTVSRVTNQIRALEDSLKEPIKYIPVKYRNSQSMGAMWDIYGTYGPVALSQAMAACDNYLQANNLVGQFLALMSDVPYEAIPDIDSQDDKGLAVGGDDSDPALPSDIKAHTFTGTDDPEKHLDELVGLDEVKTQVRQMKHRMEFYGTDSGERISGSHMVFLGPPGTGKTTIARIITRFLYDMHYIQENRCVEVDGGYLKSPYAGQTAERANAIIRYAMGGVLFIDEAYILTEDKNNSQGAEAVGVLLKALEDHRADFVCILAGYEDNMNRMLASNEGFASRIKYKVYFENFTADELVEIFKGFMRSSPTGRYRIGKSAMDMVRQHMERELKIPGFGNARVVRTTWDAILDVHADRFMNHELSEEQRFIITKEDVAQYVEKRRKQMAEDGRNFIASRNLDSSVVSLQELKQKTKPGSEDPDADLAALTGLAVVKDEIQRMKAQFEFYDGNMENNGYHMVFYGPPGTGKTTVASIMTGYLYKLGLIQDNSYLDINGDFLRGMYLGHTGKRTEAVVQYCQGMVLFLDEAYLLTSNDGQADSFGQEAVGVLLDAMEKHRKDFVVICAGYDKEMSDFLDVNSGLRSRISLEFHFQSYTPHELAQMMRGVAKANGFTVEKDVWVPLQQYFRTQVSNPKFGNGRFVRQFFESAKKSHIVNFSKGMYGDEKKYVLTLADVTPCFGGQDDQSALDEAKPGDYL